MTRAGLPHSETPGSTLPCQLPREYRRLERPSSALDAKASTMCPYQLAKQTHNTTNKHNQQPQNRPPAASAVILRAHTHELYIKTQNITIIANYHTTNHNTQSTTVRVVCSRPLSKNQEPRSPTSTHQDSLPARRLMPQTPNSVPHI